MSLRLLACFLFVLGFSIYAWRNWFVSLCAAVVLMALFEHPDMPQKMAGIQGLNPWNFLLLNVILSWWVHRRAEGLVWDMPRGIQTALLLCLGLVFVNGLRLMLNSEYTEIRGFGVTFGENVINTLKWVIPGMLFFDACRTRERIETALVCILLIFVLLSIQVIRWMPLGYAVAGGTELANRASKIIQNEIGYNRVTLSMMLGGASWALLASLAICKTRLQRLAMLGGAAAVTLGQALTGGRTGYVAWALVGIILCLLRWRRFLPLIPVAIMAVFIFLPGVSERMLQGFAGQGGNVVQQRSDYEITSGRNIAWPLVVEKIREAPIFGYGREAMVTTGLRDYLLDEYEESFPHPHNAYLQILLDSGIIGFLCVVPFFVVLLWRATRQFMDKEEPLISAVGGATASFLLALLIGSMGGQTFYPREGYVGLWAAIGLSLRVWVERERELAWDECEGADFESVDAEESTQPA